MRNYENILIIIKIIQKISRKFENKIINLLYYKKSKANLLTNKPKLQNYFSVNAKERKNFSIEKNQFNCAKKFRPKHKIFRLASVV